MSGISDPWNGDSDAYDGDPVFDPSPTPEPSLSALYKSRSRYVAAIAISSLKLVLQGYLRPNDALEILKRAATVEIP